MLIIVSENFVFVCWGIGVGWLRSGGAAKKLEKEASCSSHMYLARENIAIIERPKYT